MMGERLAKARREHRDTQSRLAERLGVSVSSIRSWEQGKNTPTHDSLMKLCRLYHISADYLLGLIQDDPFAQGPPEPLSADEQAQLGAFREFLLWKRTGRDKMSG